jgi:hypothetical protein
MPSVILIPLDSRPVNTDLPRQLAGIAGIDIAMPGLEYLDAFLTPSEPEPLFRWLAEHDESAYDITIIHINELLFGGLLNSRESAQYLETGNKLQTMFDYLLSRKRNAANRLVLVYILPRLLPSQYDEVMWEFEVELPEYSMLKHKLALAPTDGELAARLQALEGTIPREVRTRYQTVYSEAFNVGLFLLDWLDQGLVSEVVIGLDDSAEFGLNVKAFDDLKSLASQRGLEYAYFLHGADELSPLIVARHALDYRGDTDDFGLRYLSEGQEDVVLPYEAMPLIDNFKEKVAYLYSGKPVGGSLPNGNTVAYSARPKYIYLFADQESPPEKLKDGWKAIRSGRDRPRRALVGLADVAKVNGAWAPFIECVGPMGVYDCVDAYAGWNTAGNSLGTVMAHLMYWEAAQTFPLRERKAAADRHRLLQRVRIMDDYLFQSKVRQQFIDWAVEKGYPYLGFGSDWRWREANNQINALMAEELLLWQGMPRPFLHRRFGWETKGFGAAPSPPRCEFPWPRSFEIRISQPG